MASVKGVFLFPKCVISGGTFVILRALASCSGLHHDMWITEKACSLWICELARSSEVFLVMWPLWIVRPHDGDDIHQDPLLWWVRGNPASGSESPAVTAACLSSHFHRAWFMGRVGMQAYFLRSHQAVGLPAHRKVQRLGLGLAFSVYGLFLAINLEWEGRVIACCWVAEWGAGGGGGEGMRAMPWKENVQPVLPQGHLASAVKKKKKKTLDFLICYFAVPLQIWVW